MKLFAGPLILAFLPLAVTSKAPALAALWADKEARCRDCMKNPASAKVRPEVKEFIDGIPAHLVSGPAHTTDALNSPQSRPGRTLPAAPSPFPAGSYKVVFDVRGRHKAIWINTEERKPHFATISPGFGRTVGSVRLSNEADAESPNGLKLNDDELDYLIASLYGKFCSPLDEESANRLNRVKDQLLALRFSSKEALEGYHRGLVRRLRAAQ